MRRFVLTILTINIIISCSQKPTRSGQNILSCVLLGYDSMAYYFGSSAKMDSLTSGLLDDSLFINRFVKIASDHKRFQNFKIAIKPTASGNVIQDFRILVNLLNTHDMQNRYLDSLDRYEREKFNTVSIQGLLNRQPSELILPGEGNSEMANSLPADSKTLTILLYNENGLFIYSGGDISSGKSYHYADLPKLFSVQHSKADLNILIKPASSSTYKNTVSILDEMSRNEITNYKLVEINSKEEDAIKKLSPL